MKKNKIITRDLTAYRSMMHVAANKEPPLQLPVAIVSHKPHYEFIKQCAARCVAVSKKAAIAALQDKEINVDDEIEDILLQVRNHGYDSGLSDMDRMHKIINDGQQT